MAKTLVEVDDEVLAAVQRLMGNVTKKEAINASLADRLAAMRAREAFRQTLEFVTSERGSMMDQADIMEVLRGTRRGG